VPIVAPASGGPLDLVRPGVTGLLVPPDDPEALASAAAELLVEPERAKRLGEAGLRRARAEFSVARMADATLAVYERASGSSDR
jgi:glycosyltransferase involved in cell wall biosynthesis